MYEKIIDRKGKIKLKTDERKLYEYTLAVLRKNNFQIMATTPDIYNSPLAAGQFNQLKTTYEKKHISEGEKICYVCFAFKK